MISKNEVKYIQSLYHKKKRREAGAFVVEGPNSLEELLQSDLLTERIYALQEWADAHADISVPVTIIDRDELERISAQKNPNSVLAVVKERTNVKEPNWQNEFFIALDGIQDPGNMGTIIRIADWFGITHIVASEETADVYNNKVIQATMGSFTRVQVHYTSLYDFLEKQQVHVYAAVLNGTSVQKINRRQSGCLLIGNEGKGISPALSEFFSERVTIPKLGKAESLNAGVATGIILSHLISGTE